MIISKKQTGISCLFSASIITCISLGLLLSSCDDTGDSSHIRTKAPLHRVEVVTVEKKPVSLVQTVSGNLEAVTKVRLYNEESGRITKLPYYEGDFVKKGTLLVQLDNELVKTDVAKAKASREQAELDLSRLKQLLPKKISTEEEVAKAQTQLDLAVAEEKHQLTRLRRTSITAPFDGLVTRRLYEPGDMLAQQSHILTIIDPDSLRLKASLAERWLPLVKSGQPVTLRIDAFGDKTFIAKVMRIHPTIDTRTHKGIVEILLDPAPEGATAGQFTVAEIQLTATDRLVIPVHTIHYEPEGAYVFRIAEDEAGVMTAEKVFFEQGQQYGPVAEIFSVLEPGDKIVSRGYLGLRDKKKVIIAGSETE